MEVWDAIGLAICVMALIVLLVAAFTVMMRVTRSLVTGVVILFGLCVVGVFVFYLLRTIMYI